MKVPQFLYHAAPMCVYNGINKEGLKSNWGEVYAAGSIEDALTFMAFRLLDHVHGVRTIEMDGKEWNIPDLQQHPSIHVWVIDTSKTDASLWREGMDHSPAFFGAATSYVYPMDIPRDALLGNTVIAREDLVTS